MTRLFHLFFFVIAYTGVSKNRCIPKWMVKMMENPIKIHDLGGPPLFLETPIQGDIHRKPLVFCLWI